METCAICGGAETHTLTEQNGYEWLRCDNCGYAYFREVGALDKLDVQSKNRGEAYLDFYGKKYKKKMRRATKRAKFLKKIAEGKQLLDVGCNLGYMVEASRLVGMTPTGIEVSPPVVEQAKQQFPNCKFICGFLEDHDFDGEKFDIIYTSEVIEHVPDINNFMKHISEKLKPGGILYLTTPELRKYQDTKSENGWSNLHAPNHRQYFSKSNIIMFLEKHGFERVQILRNWNFKPGIKLIAYKK